MHLLIGLAVLFILTGTPWGRRVLLVGVALLLFFLVAPEAGSLALRMTVTSMDHALTVMFPGPGH